MTTLRWTYTPPPLPVQLIHQEQPGLETYDCENCSGTGLAYAHSTSPRETTCHECLGQKVIHIPADEFVQCRECGYDQEELGGNGLCRYCDEKADRA